jgi:hypothetical protein
MIQINASQNVTNGLGIISGDENVKISLDLSKVRNIDKDTHMDINIIKDETEEGKPEPKKNKEETVDPCDESLDDFLLRLENELYYAQLCLSDKAPEIVSAAIAISGVRHDIARLRKLQ